jgi:hypothetical protein
LRRQRFLPGPGDAANVVGHVAATGAASDVPHLAKIRPGCGGVAAVPCAHFTMADAGDSARRLFAGVGGPESLASRWGGVQNDVFESEESLNEIWEGSGAHRGGVVRAPEGPQGRARVVFFPDAGMLRPGRQGRSARAGFGPLAPV